MRVLNVMLGRHYGGIEQAAVDYSAALAHQGHDVTAVVASGAAIIPHLAARGIKTLSVFFPRPWNPLARLSMTRALKLCDAAVLHGNRAGKMARLAQVLSPKPRIVAVAHSRFFKSEPYFDGVIALSEKMRADRAKDTACPVYLMPNMVRWPDKADRVPFRTPVIIGTMGRFSHEKGIDIFLESLAQLKNSGVPFQAVIGGGGDIEKELHKKMTDLGLEGSTRFIGWITDKKAFFESIDVFCLSSRTESFPIALLEAMAHGVPCVATKCGGPTEILAEGKTGRLAGIDPVSIAQVLSGVVSAPDAAVKMGQAARDFVRDTFEFSVVAAKLDKIVRGAGA